jgi:hypothetical protein
LELEGQVRALLPGRNQEIEELAATRLSGMEAAIQREADEVERRLAGHVRRLRRARAYSQRGWEEVGKRLQLVWPV